MLCFLKGFALAGTTTRCWQALPQRGRPARLRASSHLRSLSLLAFMGFLHSPTEAWGEKGALVWISKVATGGLRDPSRPT